MLWSPTVDEEILQNVQNLILTAQGTQPLARAFGMPTTAVDAPEPVVLALIAAELNEQIVAYEPRAAVAEITVARDGTGQLRPTVRLQ